MENNPMRRFAFLMSATLALQSSGVFAQGFEDAVIAQLRAEGYARITMTTTLLGRVRITAEGEKGQREIVLNPRTGEVLRDVWFVAEARSGSGSGGKSSGNASGQSTSGNSGSGGNSSGGSGSSGSSGGSGGGSSSSGSDDDHGGDDNDDRDDDRDDDDKDDDGGKGRGRGGDDD